MKINVTIDVSREVLEGIFITALEGGSNYWYQLRDDAIDTIEKAVPRTETSSLSERLFKAVYECGATIFIYDADGDEEDEPIGELNADTMREGLRRCANESMWALQAEIDGEGDAVSSDAVFQYMSLGELVFG
jgi:hypothetical protein